MDIPRQALIQAIETLGLDPNQVREIRLAPSGGAVDLLCTVDGDKHVHPHYSDEVCSYTVPIKIVD